MKSTRWVITYILVASLGLWGALFMSLKFMTPGRAQTDAGQPQKAEPPSPGDLPPEFAQDVQNAAAAAAAANGGQIPPPPTQPPQVQPQAAQPQQPQNVPPQVQPQPNNPPAGQQSAAPPPPPGPQNGGAPQTTVTAPLPEGGPAVIPQFASDDQYTFDPTGRRDPFKPYKTYRPQPITGTSGPAKVIDETDPLQRWDLDRFAVVAIMWEIRQPKAMVKDPDGKMYMIGKGTKIGRNSGLVAVIREGEVAVVEQIENEGVQTKEVKILELKK